MSTSTLDNRSDSNQLYSIHISFITHACYGHAACVNALRQRMPRVHMTLYYPSLEGKKIFIHFKMFFDQFFVTVFQFFCRYSALILLFLRLHLSLFIFPFFFLVFIFLLLSYNTFLFGFYVPILSFLFFDS